MSSALSDGRQSVVATLNPQRMETSADTVQQDLGRLVLTLIELIRQLVERQSLRRVDHGDLTDDQVEAIGLTLMRLERAITQLCDEFGVRPEELNIDLGPLGRFLAE